MKKLSIFTILSLVTLSLLAQGTISGTILDEKYGDPLIGAIVVIESTSTGTSTDFDGKYSIELPANKKILTVSYTGYAAADFTVGNSNILDIQLSAGAVLEEVVVIGIPAAPPARLVRLYMGCADVVVVVVGLFVVVAK